MYPEDNDPAKWTVLEVVAFLCRDEPVTWAYGLVPPDSVALDASIRGSQQPHRWQFFALSRLRA